MPTKYTIRRPGVLVIGTAATSKLSDIDRQEVPGQRKIRPVPRAPYVVATYVSITATCPGTCPYKDHGCFAQAGFIKRFAGVLDTDARAQGLTGEQVARNEADALDALYSRGVPQDGARGGRDVRLHVGGDAATEEAARTLAGAAVRWQHRDGGSVWCFTHRWREIPVEAWGPIEVWASTETVAEAAAAQARGYRASITSRSTPKDGKAQVINGIKVVPCPYESRGISCIQCRLCLDGKLDKRVAIGFKIHGQDFERSKAERAWDRKRSLPVVT